MRFRKLFSTFLFVSVILSGCGLTDEKTSPTPLDNDGDDIQVIEKKVENVTYRCLYIYVDGYQAGGPAMWCERLIEGE